jgi:hypothetical protein
MTLAALQRDFCDWLVGAPNGMADNPHLRAGLDVYHNAYRVRLCDSLRETFERLFLWLGEDRFLAAARAHIESHPPRGWTLGVYGADFPDTLAVLYPGEPGVADLAQLDWMLSRAFDGRDAMAVVRPALAEHAWETATLRFVPTLSLGTLQSNAPEIWSALSAGEALPSIAALPAPVSVLVWRQDLVPCFRRLKPEEAAALDMMRQGQPFSALCAALAEKLGAEAGIATAGAWLGQWLQDGLIADIRPLPG